MQSESINELASALVAAQGEFSAVPKDSVNPFFKSNYAALPDVVKHATPILSKNGLAVSQIITDEDTLTTMLIHKSGQYIGGTMTLHLVKSDPQGQGSAITYARRYSYMSILGLVADVDDDGNSSSSVSVTAPAKRFDPLPGEKSFDAPKAGMITPAQSKALYAITKKKDMEIKQEVIKRWGKAEKELTSAEASAWIDELNGSGD